MDAVECERCDLVLKTVVLTTVLQGPSRGSHCVSGCRERFGDLDVLTMARIISTATGKAASQGAKNTVNGYMAFVLFSVAGLARASLSLARFGLSVDPAINA